MFFHPEDRGEMASMVYNWPAEEVDLPLDHQQHHNHGRHHHHHHQVDPLDQHHHHHHQHHISQRHPLDLDL